MIRVGMREGVRGHGATAELLEDSLTVEAGPCVDQHALEQARVDQIARPAVKLPDAWRQLPHCPAEPTPLKHLTPPERGEVVVGPVSRTRFLRTVKCMSKTAILFPGQGSQTPEMRDEVARVRPDLLTAAAEIVGEDPFARVDDGTRYAQPAIFCASLAGWDALGRPDGDFMAGHSLGELAALVAAGVLSERDGLALVALRGRLMQESGEAAGDGGMLALLGHGAAEHAPELAAAHGLAVANDNSPQQVVLSGARGALPAAAAGAKELGLRAMELPVTGAFHSPMMASAVPEFEAALARADVTPARVTVLSAVTAEPFDDVRARLSQALTMPVRWRETLLAMRALGADRFVEVGPGRGLTGLVKRTLRDVELAHA
jgi:[acyl-carrier-protein] S-malonyltransferase